MKREKIEFVKQKKRDELKRKRQEKEKELYNIYSYIQQKEKERANCGIFELKKKRELDSLIQNFYQTYNKLKSELNSILMLYNKT